LESGSVRVAPMPGPEVLTLSEATIAVGEGIGIPPLGPS
jgi:hypothetical protein